MEKLDNKYYIKIMIKVIIIAFIGLGIYAAYKLAVFYVPFLVALLISTMIEPLIKFFMNKCKMKRKPSSIISLIIFITIIGSLLTLLITSAITEARGLLAEINEPANNIYNWTIEFINNVKAGETVIPDEVMQIAQSSLEGIIANAKTFLTGVLTGIIDFASSVPTVVTYFIITILAIIFICIDREYVIKEINKHIPKKWIEKFTEIINKTWTISWNYIKAEAKLSGFCFIFVMIGLILFRIFGLDVKYNVLMAVLIGFIDLLPLFGAGAVMIPWSIYLLFTGETTLAIAILILWGLWSVLKQVLEPKFVSKQMGMHPIFTLVGMYTGFKIMGVLGLILGPIILLIIKTVFKDLFERGVLKTFFELE